MTGAAVLLAMALAAMALLLWREVRRRRALEFATRDHDVTFRLLTEHSTDIVSRLDAQGGRLYMSPAAEAVFGRPVKQLLAEPALGQVVEEDLPQVQAALAGLSKSERSICITYRIRRPDGRLVWLEASACPVIDERSGRYDGIIIVARDVTERKAAEEQLALLARTDALTGLANRRCLDETLAAEWRRARRDGTSLSLILLDVDRFKLFNDSYGHPAGDGCLRRIADAIAVTVRRPADLVARYGGEEIAVLLPDTPAEGAAQVAEQTRAAIEALGLPHAANAPAGIVTVSLGVACAIPATAAGGTAEALIAAADGALYEAKRAGRNRLGFAASVPPPPMPPPIPAAEPARLRALAAFERAGATRPGHEELDRIVRLTAALLGTPIALVSLIGSERQSFVAALGMDSEGTSREVSFCAHLMASEEDALVVPDAALDARFAGNPLVTGWPGIRFYAGAPLICPRTGHRLGALCSIDQAPRAPLTAAERAVLADLAAMAMDALERRRTAAETLFA